MPYSAQQWNAAIDDSWQVFYNMVATCAPAVLDTVDPITTAQVVERLYPTNHTALGRMVHNRMYKALAALATRQLASYARRGDTIHIRVKTPAGNWVTKSRRPWHWFTYGSPNDEVIHEKICPTCGTKMKPAALSTA